MASDVTHEVEAVVAGSQIEVVAVSTSLVTAKSGDEGPSMNARENENEEDKGVHEHCFVREWLLLRGVPLKEEKNGGGKHGKMEEGKIAAGRKMAGGENQKVKGWENQGKES